MTLPWGKGAAGLPEGERTASTLLKITYGVRMGR